MTSRRTFLASLGAAGFVTGLETPVFSRATDASYKTLPIRVNNPTTIGSWTLDAERIPIAEGYKPYMALLPTGELLLVSLAFQASPYREFTPSWRSFDGGKTWAGPVVFADVIGREQCLTCLSTGTLLMCGALLANDINNTLGFVHSYIHRSTDGGHSWQRQRIIIANEPEIKGSMASRNVVEMPDGSLLLGVSQNETSTAYLWKSTDDGQTWTQSNRVQIGNYRGSPYDNFDGFFSEDFTYLNKQGKLLHFIRCGLPSPMFPMRDNRTVPSIDDGGDRTLRCESRDGGHSWDHLADYGDYGVHYPRVLRLRDGRLLMTLTQRSVFYPIGLQAIISSDDGETWNFDERIIIDGLTSWGSASGGGFGNTIQLPTDDLVSCYSYRTGDKTMIEAVRWNLPSPESSLWAGERDEKNLPGRHEPPVSSDNHPARRH